MQDKTFILTFIILNVTKAPFYACPIPSLFCFHRISSADSNVYLSLTLLFVVTTCTHMLTLLHA